MDELLKLLLEKGFDVTPVLDGEYHRFDRGGKILAGWFKGIEVRDAHDQVLWMEAEFGDWYTRERHSWAGGKNSSNMTEEQLAELALKRKELAEKTRAEKERNQEIAAKDANRLWDSAIREGVEKHPYIVKKGIRPGNHAKLLGDKLCIPVRIEGKITSLQLIAADGSKKFLSRGRLDKTFTYWEEHNSKLDVLYICEGYATAASVGMATGLSILVAFNTGNLVKICRDLEEVIKYRPNSVVICADNDNKKEGENPGLEAADQAARALRDQGIPVRVVAPQASAGTACDWNDFHVSNGLDKLRIALVGAPKDSGSVQAPAETAAGEQKTVPEPVPPPSTRALLLRELPGRKDFPRPPLRKNKKGEVVAPYHQDVANCLLEGFGESFIRDAEDPFFLQGPYWEQRHASNFRRYLHNMAQYLRQGEAKQSELTSIGEMFMNRAQAVPDSRSFFQQNPFLANFLDGTLEVIKRPGGQYEKVFREHRKTDMLTWVLPYRYLDPRPTNPVFNDWLARAFEEDPDASGKIRALSQIGGACLVSLFPRLALLVGPGGTGKSTFAKLCMKFLGAKNYSSVPPHLMEGFYMEQMINKQVNVVTDIGKDPVGEAFLKLVEDNIPMQVNRKGRPVVLARLPALHIFCANKLPRGVDGETNAMDRRVTIVEFSRSMLGEGGTQYTRDFEEIIMENGPGAVLDFFEMGLDDLLANGGKYFNPASGVAKLKQWKDSESLTAQFLEAIAHDEIEALKLDPGAKIERKIVAAALATWSGRLLSNQAQGRLFADLDARGFHTKGVDGKRYVHGMGSRVADGSTRF